MLTKKPTKKMIDTWKKIFENKGNALKPNRIGGVNLIEYFVEKYKPEVYNDERFKEVVLYNLKNNTHEISKFPDNVKFKVYSYKLGDILVGIELLSGEFYVECEDIDKAVPIYDDLFITRGLDMYDLDSYFLVAEYIRLKKKKRA